MTYEKQDWNNFEAGGTPITATQLDHIEAGIEQAAGFYGWAAEMPPQVVPSGMDDRRFNLNSVADVRARPGEMVFSVFNLNVFGSSGSLLTSETANGMNPGPYYEPTAGPGGGPALAFYPAGEKGSENSLLSSQLDIGDSNFSLVFVPPEDDYTILIPGVLESLGLFLVGQTGDTFYVANGDNSRAYTTEALTAGVPHLLTITMREYLFDEDGETPVEGQSRIMVDGVDIVEPGQLWIDDPLTEFVSPVLAISNIALAEEPVLFLWVVRWNLPDDFESDIYYLSSIESYARHTGCPLPPPPGDD